MSSTTIHHLRSRSRSGVTALNVVNRGRAKILTETSPAALLETFFQNCPSRGSGETPGKLTERLTDFVLKGGTRRFDAWKNRSKWPLSTNGTEDNAKRLALSSVPFVLKGQPLGLEGQYEVSCHQAQNRGLILFPFIKGNLSAGAFPHASQLQERLHSGLNLMVMCAKPHEMTLCLRDKKLSLRNVVLHIGSM